MSPDRGGLGWAVGRGRPLRNSLSPGPRGPACRAGVQNCQDLGLSSAAAEPGVFRRGKAGPHLTVPSGLWVLERRVAPGRRRGLHRLGLKGEPSPCGRSREASGCPVRGGGGCLTAPAAPGRGLRAPPHVARRRLLPAPCRVGRAPLPSRVSLLSYRSDPVRSAAL